MRKELKPFVEETLLSQNAHIERYFNRQGIEKILSANLNGENYSKEIFSLVVLELWHKEFVDSLPASCYPS
jgi:asparagine synthase (glutamine-hydrolysing)